MSRKEGPIELKRLHRDALDAARDRARHYRLLNQPYLAESIFRDILEADPDDETSRVGLIMTLCDQFASERAHPVSEVLGMASVLDDRYARAYYAGLVCERKAEAHLIKGGPGSGSLAYDWFHRAMTHYEEAEPLRPAGNDDALLRWNTCARIINTRNDVRPRSDDGAVQLLE
jgi:hypothetical protein